MRKNSRTTRSMMNIDLSCCTIYGRGQGCYMYEVGHTQKKFTHGDHTYSSKLAHAITKTQLY